MISDILVHLRNGGTFYYKTIFSIILGIGILIPLSIWASRGLMLPYPCSKECITWLSYVVVSLLLLTLITLHLFAKYPHLFSVIRRSRNAPELRRRPTPSRPSSSYGWQTKRNEYNSPGTDLAISYRRLENTLDSLILAGLKLETSLKSPRTVNPYLDSVSSYKSCLQVNVEEEDNVETFPEESQSAAEVRKTQTVHSSRVQSLPSIDSSALRKRHGCVVLDSELNDSSNRADISSMMELLASEADDSVSESQTNKNPELGHKQDDSSAN